MTVAENRFQESFGTPKDTTRGKVRDHLHPWVQEFISSSPFAVLATSNAAGSCDASPRGGKPGFVKVLDEHTLLVPDVAGNRLFQSYSNIENSPDVALLFLLPGVDETVRVNGRAEILHGEELERRQLTLEVYQPDDNARNQQALLISVTEAFGHCPRALRFSRLWNTEAISAHRSERPISKKPPGV